MRNEADILTRLHLLNMDAGMDTPEDDTALVDLEDTKDDSVVHTQSSSVLSVETFSHALSGATGSILAMSTFYPLDTIRTRLQVDDKREAKNTFRLVQEICEEEGVTTLYRGLVPVLSSLYCSNFVYFYTFHGLKKFFHSNKMKSNPGMDLMLGYVAGITNSLLTTPLWVANTRLKLQGIKKINGKKNDNDKKTNYTGLLDALQKISKEEGIKALWKGIQTSFLLSANPAIQFMVYEAIKRFVQRLKRTKIGKIKQISSFEFFVMGGAAKAVATVLTYPLQLAQCRLRASKDTSKKENRGLVEVLYQIYSNRGIFGLFKGLEAKLYQTVLTAALMFLVYEKLMKFIMTILRVKK